MHSASRRLADGHRCSEPDGLFALTYWSDGISGHRHGYLYPSKKEPKACFTEHHNAMPDPQWKDRDLGHSSQPEAIQIKVSPNPPDKGILTRASMIY